MSQLRGYIKLHRQLREHEIWLSERFTRGQAWVDLLMLANHKPAALFIRGIEISLKLGELCYSQKSLAKRWGWDVKTVVTFLRMLRRRQMLEVKTNNITSVITITNWNRYQTSGEQTAYQNGEQKETRTETENNANNGENKDCQDKKIRPLPRNKDTYVRDPGSPVNAFKTWWAEQYRAQFKVGYIFTHGKEEKLIQSLLTACQGDVERLKAVAHTFFTSTDPFIKEAGRTIGVFRSLFNKLALQHVSQHPNAIPQPTETERILMGENHAE